MKLMKQVAAGLALSGLVLGFPAVGSAVLISYDEVIYQSTTENPSYLSGSVDMTFSGSTLTITLTNTSQNGAATSDTSGNLLTGVAFNLPTGLSVTGGSVSMTGSTAVNFVAPADGDVSKEWGYDSNPLESGAFLDLATTSTNTAVSSMESQTTNQFHSGSLFQPVNLDGPDGGLLSGNDTTGLGGGVEGITDHVVITLNIAGTYSGNLLSYIDDNGVVLSFGSPTTTGQRVPEPGTLLLLGSGLCGLALMRRRQRQ
jgi:hypothetical protein